MMHNKGFSHVLLVCLALVVAGCTEGYRYASRPGEAAPASIQYVSGYGPRQFQFGVIGRNVTEYKAAIRVSGVNDDSIGGSISLPSDENDIVRNNRVLLHPGVNRLSFSVSWPHNNSSGFVHVIEAKPGETYLLNYISQGDNPPIVQVLNSQRQVLRSVTFRATVHIESDLTEKPYLSKNYVGTKRVLTYVPQDLPLTR